MKMNADRKFLEEVVIQLQYFDIMRSNSIAVEMTF